MFGKNYDKEIEFLRGMVDTQNKTLDKILELMKSNQEGVSNNQKAILEIAKVQVSHKKAIELLAKT